MISLYNFVSEELNLRFYNKVDREAILKIMFSFFLGHYTYNRASYILCKNYGKNLKDGGMQRKFSALTSKVGEKEVDYIMKNLRGKLNNKKFKVFRSDWEFIEDHINFIPTYSNYPLEEKVLTDISPFIRNLSYKLKMFLSKDNSKDVFDITNDLLLYASLGYRKYIYDYNKTIHDTDNYKLLLSLVYKTVRNGGIDYIGSSFTAKRKISLKTSSIEDFNDEGEIYLDPSGDVKFAEIRRTKFNED